MTEQQYKELLQTLGINVANSNLQIKELLEAKLNEYLDRTDAEAEQKASDVQDAMDYLEDLIVKMGGGIALAPEETEEESQNSFTDRIAGRKGAITYTSSSATGGATAGSVSQAGTTSAGTTNQTSHPWFYSATGDKNIEDLFKLAEGDLAQGDYRHAESVYDTILRTEMTNAGAYMGKVLARYKLQEPKDIATCFTQGLETDSDLKRVENCGNDKQKKFIQDALEERRKGKIYVEAETVLQTSKNSSELLQAAANFDSISGYRDATAKAYDCREASKKIEKQEELFKEKERKRKEFEKEREVLIKKSRKKEKRIKWIKKAAILLIVINFIILLYDTGTFTALLSPGISTGGSLLNAFYFGKIDVEDGFDRVGASESVRWCPFVTSIAAEEIADLNIGNCKRLKKVIAKDVNNILINACPRLESADIEKTARVNIYECEELKNVKISGEFIQDAAFFRSVHVSECEALTDLEILGGNATNISIADCASLENLKIPDSFSGELFIYNCDSLKDFEIPVNVESVEISECDYLDDYKRD